MSSLCILIQDTRYQGGDRTDPSVEQMLSSLFPKVGTELDALADSESHLLTPSSESETAHPSSCKKHPSRWIVLCAVVLTVVAGGLVIASFGKQGIATTKSDPAIAPIASNDALRDAVVAWCTGGTPREETVKLWGPIEAWDTANVTNMDGLFCGDSMCSYDYIVLRECNVSITEWNTSSVLSMNRMFYNSQFSGDISLWNTSSVLSMDSMFYNSQFSGDISLWDTSSVLSMDSMFYNSQFSGDISLWNTSRVKSMLAMFYSSAFSGDVSLWETSAVLTMHAMFFGSPFNGDVSAWDTSSVTDMGFMFASCPFNGAISNWNTKSVSDMSYMFSSSKFNGVVADWNTSSVTDMGYMFFGSEFSGVISDWDVTLVSDFTYFICNDVLFENHLCEPGADPSWKLHYCTGPNGTPPIDPC